MALSGFESSFGQAPSQNSFMGILRDQVIEESHTTERALDVAKAFSLSGALTKSTQLEVTDTILDNYPDFTPSLVDVAVSEAVKTIR